ncbi:unnamed protein product, partial [Chrysoparadoxa australica]
TSTPVQRPLPRLSKGEEVMPAGMEQIAQQIAGQAILDHAKETEKRLDEKLAQLDALGEDDFEKLRERRKLQMQKRHHEKQKWLANGHGRCVYSELSPTRSYFGTLYHRFLKINAEKAPYLAEKLNIYIMPTILLVKDTQTVHQIRGFDEMGGGDDFSDDMLAWVMGQWGVCNYEGDPPEDPTQNSGYNSINLMKRGNIKAAEEFSDGDDNYD